MTTEKTVLVVDDEEFIRGMLERMLAHGNYRVLTAANGEQALEILLGADGRSVDLVILDVMMPGMGGKKTYHAIRALGRDIKILLSSGFGREGDVQEIMTDGSDGFIQKPFIMNELLAAIKKIIDKAG